MASDVASELEKTNTGASEGPSRRYLMVVPFTEVCMASDHIALKLADGRHRPTLLVDRLETGIYSNSAFGGQVVDKIV